MVSIPWVEHGSKSPQTGSFGTYTQDFTRTSNRRATCCIRSSFQRWGEPYSAKFRFLYSQPLPPRERRSSRWWTDLSKALTIFASDTSPPCSNMGGFDTIIYRASASYFILFQQRKLERRLARFVLFGLWHMARLKNPKMCVALSFFQTFWLASSSCYRDDRMVVLCLEMASGGAW